MVGHVRTGKRGRVPKDLTGRRGILKITDAARVLEAYAKGGYAGIVAELGDEPCDADGKHMNAQETIAWATELFLGDEAKRTAAARVMDELGKLAFADIRKAVKWGSKVEVQGEDGDTVVANGVVLKDSSEIDAATAAAISEVSQGKDGLKIKFHSKDAALKMMGTASGLLVDKLDVTGKIEEVRRVIVNPDNPNPQGV